MTLFNSAPAADEHKPLTLRPYQREAVDAVYRHLREHDDNPCVVIPTGGGKSAAIAAICSDAVTLWGGRVLVVAHVKELLEQNFEKLHRLAPGIDAGLYSASLGRRDTQHAVVVAGVQSIYQRAAELGRFDLIIVDECHLLNPEGDGMYRRLISEARTSVSSDSPQRHSASLPARSANPRPRASSTPSATR